MAKPDALFLLIKSLTKSEKRYFKLTAKFQGQHQKYLGLFKALDKMDHYDEDEIRTKYGHEPFTRQLHVVKNYLSKLIMKSLRSYHAKDTISAQLQSQLQDIEILYKKDLLKLCYKSVCKTEKLAKKVGDERALLEAINWKRRVLLNVPGIGDSKQLLDTLIVEEEAVLQNLLNECEYWSLTLKVGSMDRQIDQQPPSLIKDASFASTHRAKILHYHLVYVTQTMLGDLKAAEAALDTLILYLENDPFRLKNDPGPYITALNNKIGLFLNQKKLEKIPSLLNKIRTIPIRLGFKSGGPLSMKLMIRTYNVELETFRDSGQVAKGINLIPTIRAFLDENMDNISRQYQVMFNYQFAYMYFMNSDYRQALRDVNAVLSHRYYAERNDIVGYAQFLNLIIHYELGNITVLKYSVDSTRRYLKKRGSLMEFEKLLLRLFSNISTRPQSHHRSLFTKAYQKLFGNPPLINETQLDYLDFKYWLGTKAKGGFNNY